MKILQVIALSAIAITASAQSYKITGTAGNKLEGKMLYLLDQKDMQPCDSCVVTDGAFSFEGKAKKQKLFLLSQKSTRTRVAILADKGATITVDLSANPTIVTDNGGLNDKKTAFESEVAAAGKAIDAKGMQLFEQGLSNEEIQAALKEDIEAVYNLYRNTIKKNKKNMLGAYVLTITAPTLYNSLEELDKVTKGMKYANDLYAIKSLREGLIRGEATSAGKMFTDFEGFTVDGKPSRLSDYVGKGKYVLVDYWASWCGPCRGEIPNLIELQAQFGGEKFTVLGVNVWDQEEKFKEALTNEGITYPQIYIPMDNKDNVTEMYNIQGIPQIMLFGPDGTIVKRDLRGQSMKNFVAEQLK